MEKIRTEVNVVWGSLTYTVDNVEAFRCTQCGEKVYPKEEVERLQNLAESLLGVGSDDKENNGTKLPKS